MLRRHTTLYVPPPVPPVADPPPEPNPEAEERQPVMLIENFFRAITEIQGRCTPTLNAYLPKNYPTIFKIQ